MSHIGRKPPRRVQVDDTAAAGLRYALRLTQRFLKSDSRRVRAVAMRFAADGLARLDWHDWREVARAVADLVAEVAEIEEEG